MDTDTKKVEFSFKTDMLTQETLQSLKCISNFGVT